MNSATEQFYRGDKSRNSKKHYGIGLYIAKNYAKQHRGNIYLSNSEKLVGAKVVLEISYRCDGENAKDFVFVHSLQMENTLYLSY